MLQHHDGRQQADAIGGVSGDLPRRVAIEDSEVQVRPLVEDRMAPVLFQQLPELLRRGGPRGLPGGPEEFLASRPMADDLLFRLRLDGVAGHFANQSAHRRQFVARHAQHFQPRVTVGLPAKQERLAQQPRRGLHAQPFRRLWA